MHAEQPSRPNGRLTGIVRRPMDSGRARRGPLDVVCHVQQPSAASIPSDGVSENTVFPAQIGVAWPQDYA